VRRAPPGDVDHDRRVTVRVPAEPTFDDAASRLQRLTQGRGPVCHPINPNGKPNRFVHQAASPVRPLPGPCFNPEGIIGDVYHRDDWVSQLGAPEGWADLLTVADDTDIKAMPGPISPRTPQDEVVQPIVDGVSDPIALPLPAVAAERARH
jgi:hypothetical protein